MERRGDWIQTYSGRAFWPMDPRPEDVSIVDIAHSLAMQCRFAGHSHRFYSVAEHSILMATMVPAPVALWALLHDASEAYLVDVPRPLKPFLPGYREAEAAIMAAICQRFGLPEEMPPEVKEADAAILHTEAKALMGPPPMTWAHMPPPLAVQPVGWFPEEAKRRFLSAFGKLYNPETQGAAA